MFDALYQNVTETDAANVRGQWYYIRAIHDLYAGEAINVGVAFRDDLGKMHTHVIDSPGRLVCLYGETVAESMKFLAQVAKEAFLLKEPLSPSPNIVLVDGGEIAGESATDILGFLFQDVVSIARECDEEKAPKNKRGPDLQSLRAEVYRYMRAKAGMDADRIIAMNPRLEIKFDAGSRYLDVPLQGTRHFGALESAWYRSAQSVELKLLNAALDLEAAASCHRAEQLGFFVARPGSDSRFFRDAEQLNNVDNAIDTVVWRLRTQGIRVEVEDTTERLAERILEWAA